ncbi:MAG: hypothetical protein OEM07_01060 [Gammaproteobacteria bacterium]|nr:hypothetical protein [Gammaproteobacteria bacterium]
MPLCQCRDIIKHREIRFTRSLTEPDQAERAVRLLIGISGIKHAVPARPNTLHIRYDVREISLQMLESALTDVGFTLHNNLAIRLKRELITYCEDAMRSNLGIETEQQNTLALKCDSLHHNNLDPRPDHWRNYV